MSDDETTRILPRKNILGGGDLTKTSPIGGLVKNNRSQTGDEHTRIFRPKQKSTTADLESTGETIDDFTTDPVVGWLVVVSGPGRGHFAKLGYGVNSIGRGAQDRVTLDFGDEEISRQGHAMLTYDTKGKKFYIQHGGGINLTYLGNTPVLQPHEIKGREIICIGNTNLCFIPFCGSDFEWNTE
jgi:hypothetical protein